MDKDLDKRLNSMGDDLRVIIVGASGGIGQSFARLLSKSPQITHIYALSRRPCPVRSPKLETISMDFEDEASIKAATDIIKAQGRYDLVIIASGFLHDNEISPEKNMRALSREGFLKAFSVNTIGPALCAKHFLPLMRRDRKTVFTALSARVGSISDNRLGGWYAYRAAKAALNMTLKGLSIEHKRRFTDCVIIGLHPGTVDTALSAPYQGNVAEGKLFTADYSAGKMLDVIDQVQPSDSGNCFDYGGEVIAF